MTVLHDGRPGDHALPPGIMSRSSGEPQLQWVPNLDDLPDPRFANDGCQYQVEDRVLFGDPLLCENAFEHYGEPDLHETLGSRGCPYRCTYCSAPLLSSQKIRVRSVDRVIGEVQRMRGLKPIHRVTFLDEVFGARLDWVRDLAERFPAEVGLPFTAEIHPELCTEARIALCAQAGLAGIEMGVQSGSERVRREIFNRSTGQQTIIDAVTCLVQHRVAVTIDLILDNPYETEADLRQTFELLLTLPRPLGIKTFSLCHLPGTALTNRLLEAGLIAPDDVEDQAFKTHRHWRARVRERREPWRQYWTNLILLASLRELPDTRDSWLATATNQGTPPNRFSPDELQRIAADPFFVDQPERLEELFLASIPKSQTNLV